MKPMTAKKRDALQLDRPYVAPATDIERSVASIICGVLDLDAVGRDDRFFDLGLDSFSGLQVSLAAEDQLGLALDTNWMTDEATLQTLCAKARKIF